MITEKGLGQLLIEFIYSEHNLQYRAFVHILSNLYVTLGLCNLRSTYIFYLAGVLPWERLLELSVPCQKMPLSLRNKEPFGVLSLSSEGGVVHISEWGQKAYSYCLSRLLTQPCCFVHYTEMTNGCWLIIYIVNWNKGFLWYCSFKACRNSRVFDKTNSLSEVPSQCLEAEFREEQCSWGESR